VSSRATSLDFSLPLERNESSYDHFEKSKNESKIIHSRRTSVADPKGGWTPSDGQLHDHRRAVIREIFTVLENPAGKG
jgi:hypothetical protein